MNRNSSPYVELFRSTNVLKSGNILCISVGEMMISLLISEYILS